MNEEQTTLTEIKHNIVFLDLYFNNNINILHDTEKQKIFTILTHAVIEDPYCFMRIVLYIANTRHTDRQELFYRTVIHFISTTFPEMVMANLQLIINFGKKDDILYFVQCPGISQRVATWIKHKAKEDPDFITLLDGKLINSPVDRRIRYKPKFGKNKRWSTFIYKILDDPSFNGIIV